jgi:GDPmannose 4,6-dehydratase
VKRVIITGVTGQSGSYFVEYLLQHTDYEIYGMVRRLSVKNHNNISHLVNNPRFHIFSGDLNDAHSLSSAIDDIKPDYFINCAAQSFVAESWVTPAQTFMTDAVSTIHILEAIRKSCPKCRTLVYGSSEEFGNVEYSPQNEKHPLKARSPYAAAKIASRQIVKVYRESYSLFVIQPWNFNFESRRRGFEFVTRKITLGVARIFNALKNKQTFSAIELGNIDSKRDWSHANDIVNAAWLMLNQDKPKEYVISSNETHSVREFIELAFKEAGIEGFWHGERTNEEFSIANYLVEEYDIRSSVLVKINPKFYRPAEVELLWGDSDLARKELGWYPKYSFQDLVKEMVRSDIADFNLV